MGRGVASPEVVGEGTAEHRFPFRPWVRSSTRTAMLGGVGLIVLLGLLAWWMGGAPLGRALGVLALYGIVFLLSLLKVWWTAGRPAVVLAEEKLRYRPLHTLRPWEIAYASILECGPRPKTLAYRVVCERPGRPRQELFLNLGVIREPHELLRLLGEKLEQIGLEPAPQRRNAWRRPE